ncbi:4-alpha-glucanotransferase, putative [Eimeria praecox]|uniref:4-alpha-glucanotransferase n=1 Tax=Eimeria praecox TaxID=51316 RepID=U6H9C7_9EIME|nr:4-alpha-glucanotransferase, putative [Eimeria praecox]
MDFMYEGRNAGVLLHLTSLPSKCGIVGDFGESAEPFLAYLKDAGFSYWQVLPVGPCTYSQSQPGCPYLSTSSFALNPLFVCPAGLVTLGLVTAEEVSHLVAKWQAKQEERKALRAEGSSQEAVECGDFVDYHVAKGYKDELLAIAYNAFIKNAPTEEYDEFYQHLTDTAITGPIEQLLPQFHRFVQFILSQQWSQLRRQANINGIKILGDIAFYVNMHSSDAWSNSEMFQMDTATNRPLYVSGVPPDYFSAEGQLWGHPVYAWDAHERTNFSWWTRRLAKSFEKFDACRLDHFRGFESYWRVPYDFAIQHRSARNGEWVQGPGTKLFDAIFKNMGWENPRVNVATAYSEALSKHAKQPSVKKRLANMINKHIAKSKQPSNNSGAPHSFGTLGRGESSRPAPLLIAEDLGFITPEIVALRDKYSIFSMRVMQFAWADKEKGLRCEHLPYNHTRDCVVYTGTHDNSTSQSWWKTASSEEKKHLLSYLGLSEEPATFAVHRLLAHLALLSVANLVILPVQDILGLDDRARFNLPGVDCPKNWSWKLSSLGPLYAPENLNPLRDMLILSNRYISSESLEQPI